MPCPIIDGLITFMQTNLDAWIWDGEVPRFDPDGNPVNPTSAVVPSNFPALRLYEVEPGFDRTWTFGDRYSDEGYVLLQSYATSRAVVEATMTDIEVLLANDDKWVQITAALGPTPDEQPPGYGITQILLQRWWSGQDRQGASAATRTASGELLYRGDQIFFTQFRGSLITGPTSAK